MKPVTAIISDGLYDRLLAVYGVEHVDPQALAASAIQVEVTRLEQLKRRVAKRVVGRPRLTAEQKAFRDNVQYLDEIYHSLSTEIPQEDFDRIYGEQATLYRNAVNADDHKLVQWWFDNCPWQMPTKFKERFEDYKVNGRSSTESI